MPKSLKLKAIPTTPPVVAEEDMAAHEDEDPEEDVVTDASPMNGQSENTFTAQKKDIGQAIAL